jgi:hypothetical protein
MQHDDERARLLQLGRHECEHAQVAGIGAEAGDFGKRAAQARASPQLGQTQPIQPWQTSQEIDISG